MRPQRTISLTLATLALTWAAPGVTPATASFVNLTDDPAASHSAPGVLHYGLNYTLSGSTHITQAIPGDIAGRGATATLDATMTFSLGTPYQVNTDGSVFYRVGGFVSIVGSFNGGAQETILETTFMGGGSLIPDIYSPGTSSTQGFTMVATLAPDFAEYFRVGQHSAGQFALVFQPTDAVDYALTGDHAGVRMDVVGLGAVPEPASLGMMGVGGALAGGLSWARGRIRRRAG